MTARLALAAIALAAAAGCAGTRSGGDARPLPRPVRAEPAPPATDSVTTALWRLDESAGQRCDDAGPYRLDGIAGIDTRADFGRYRGGRTFTRTPQSFVLVRDNPVFATPRSFTAEAWVLPQSHTAHELQVIAARWNGNPNEQSWVLGLVGQKLAYPAVRQESPGWFRDVVLGAPTGRLVFGLLPENAAGPRGFASTASVPLGRWTHVAASVDGEVVQLYIDGRLDAQHVLVGGFRNSVAPLTLGNALDPRRLTDFGGDLRLDPGPVEEQFYGFHGTLDEVRLSSRARSAFDSTELR